MSSTSSGSGVEIDLLLADPHGHTVMTMAVEQALVQSVGAYTRHGEFGAADHTTPPVERGGLGWHGASQRPTDAASGLILMGARVYNPETALFTSPDPVPGGNVTPYVYPQDPINWSDTSGQFQGNFENPLPRGVRGVYIIYFTNGQNYVGSSNDIRKRLNQHNSTSSRFSKLTVASITYTKVPWGSDPKKANEALRKAEQRVMNNFTDKPSRNQKYNLNIVRAHKAGLSLAKLT